MGEVPVFWSPHHLKMLQPHFHLTSAPHQTIPPERVEWQASFLGIDLVDVRRIRASLVDFGVRFERRLFTEQEIMDASPDPVVKAERLAARFAAKEAALKAFGLGAVGVNWRELEVVRRADGAPVLQVHGKAEIHLRQIGATHWALSLSHDGDQAIAIVAGFKNPSTPTLS
jgi:holo-[acyl-carrier protein] synthase